MKTMTFLSLVLAAGLANCVRPTGANLCRQIRVGQLLSTLGDNSYNTSRYCSQNSALGQGGAIINKEGPVEELAEIPGVSHFQVGEVTDDSDLSVYACCIISRDGVIVAKYLYTVD